MQKRISPQGNQERIQELVSGKAPPPNETVRVIVEELRERTEEVSILLTRRNDLQSQLAGADNRLTQLQGIISAHTGLITKFDTRPAAEDLPAKKDEVPSVSPTVEDRNVPQTRSDSNGVQ